MALVLATAGLTGCIGLGGDDAEATGPENATTQSVEGEAASNAAGEAEDEFQPASFPSEAPVATLWANGTFSAHESCLAGGCFTGTAFQQTELSSELPQDAPAVVTATLTTESGNSALLDAIDVYMYGQEMTFYDYQASEEGDEEVDRATVLKGNEPLVVEVAYYGPDGQAPEAEYTLRIDIDAQPDVIPPGVPVEIDAEPGQTYEAKPVDGEGGSQGSPSLLIYNSEDAFVSELGGDGGSLETTVPPDAPEGKPVLVVPEDSPPLAISTNVSDTQMRALPLAFEPGDAHPVEGPQPVEWSFELSDRPLAVGMYYTTQDGPPVSASFDDGHAQIAGPQGNVLDADLGCNFCISTSYGTGVASDIGADGVTAGSYDATFEPGGDAGYAVGQFTMTYDRGE